MLCLPSQSRARSIALLLGLQLRRVARSWSVLGCRGGRASHRPSLAGDGAGARAGMRAGGQRHGQGSMHATGRGSRGGTPSRVSTASRPSSRIILQFSILQGLAPSHGGPPANALNQATQSSHGAPRASPSASLRTTDRCSLSSRPIAAPQGPAPIDAPHCRTRPWPLVSRPTVHRCTCLRQDEGTAALLPMTSLLQAPTNNRPSSPTATSRLGHLARLPSVRVGLRPRISTALTGFPRRVTYCFAPSRALARRDFEAIRTGLLHEVKNITKWLSYRIVRTIVLAGRAVAGEVNSG